MKENDKKQQKLVADAMQSVTLHAGRVLFQSRAARRRYERIFTKMQKNEKFDEKREKMRSSKFSYF